MSAGHLRRDRTAVLPKRARKIYAVCAHPLRALEPLFDLFPPPVQCGGCCALRATMIIRLRPYMAGPRPARSHCFRYFSRCLIFWCFWIKPKAQKKKCTTEEIDSYFGKYPAPPIGRFLRGADLPPFVTERWRQKCPQGTSVGIGRRCSLSGHKRLRCCGAKDCTASTVAARQSPQEASALACCPSFCTPAPGARTAVRSVSSSGAMRRLLCAARNCDYLFASARGRPLVFRRDGCLSSGSS